MTRSRSVAKAPKNAKPSGVDVLDRAFSILFAFRISDESLSLAELVKRTGLYNSTVLRLAGSLIHHRFLTKLADKRYKLGPAAFTLGSIYQASLDIGEVLLPLMRQLNAELGEAVSFHVREGDARVCLYRVASSYSVGPQVRVGDIQSLEHGAGGRVLSAFSGGVGPVYDHIRQTFHYMSLGERDPEIGGVSCPVFGPGQRLVGALGIVGPITRMNLEYMTSVRGRLLGACAQATSALGGDPGPLERALALPCPNH